MRLKFLTVLYSLFLYLLKKQNRGVIMLPQQNKRGDKKTPQKKSFSIYKKNTFKSLNDVEYFLNNLKDLKRFIKIYKLLK